MQGEARANFRISMHSALTRIWLIAYAISDSWEQKAAVVLTGMAG